MDARSHTRRAEIAADVIRRANRRPTPSLPPWRLHIPERARQVDLRGELPSRLLHELEQESEQ
jgi:hypothetical protein